MAETASSSGQDHTNDRKINLHPLAIVAVSDHCTNIHCGASVKAKGSKVLGILWGKQQGLEVSISDAVELSYELNEKGEPIISPTMVNQQKSLMTEVYKNYDMLGWYSVGTELDPIDYLVHREMLQYNESAFFLLMHPNPHPDSKELPVSLYESVMHQVNDEMKMEFAPCNFQLDTTQAERITMEEVAKATPTDGISTIDLHITSLKSSIQSLENRTKVLVDYLERSKRGDVPMDHKLLRHIAHVCHQLPAADTSTLQSAFLEDYNDTLLVTNLAQLTKATAMLNDLISKVNTSGPSTPHRF